MQLTLTDKKWLQIFKTFAEKALLPQIKQAGGSLGEWEIFQSLISAPNINQNQIQLFVDSLPPFNINSNNKTEKVNKLIEFSQTGGDHFYINKTFGGEKGKNNFMDPTANNASHNRRESFREEISKPQGQPRSSGIILGLGKLLKSLQQNQIYIQSMSKENYIHGQNLQRPPLNYTTSSSKLGNAPNLGHQHNHLNRTLGQIRNLTHNQYKQMTY